MGWFWRATRDNFTIWFAFLLPLVALPLPLLDPTPVSQCGYCVIVIALYWVTEVVPLPVTALMPVLFFPLFGILSVDRAISNFATRPFMLFLSSLIVASGVEKWNLHKRLALKTLTLVGPQPRWLLIGVMFPTWFMSMWISNTAATAMMLPIVLSMLLHLKECQGDGFTDSMDMVTIEGSVNQNLEKPLEGARNEKGGKNGNINKAYVLTSDTQNGQTKVPMADVRTTPKMSEERFIRLAKTFTLATCYAANIGGMATLIGTPPNIIFKRLADTLYKEYGADNPVNFANWLAMGVPLAIILIVVCWFWLLLYAEGLRFIKFWRKDHINYESVRKALKKDYEELGPMSFPEIMMTVAFIVLVILWVTREPGLFRGWGSLFKDKHAGDSTPSILVAVLLFILPARPPNWLRRFSCACIGATDDVPRFTDKPYEPLLDWKTTNSILAWNILILIGGGFALADGCEASGFSDWVSDHLDAMTVLPPWFVILILTTFVSVFTEVACNGAAVVLFVPMMGHMAIRMGVNPLYFMIPGTCASNLSFSLPASHPSNAIVFNSGYLRVIDMAKAGFGMNILSILLLNVGLHTWMNGIYGLDSLPDDFKTAATTVMPNITTLAP